jgi:hypothetical protein
MYALLILFFASLIGIIVMIGRKLVVIRNQPTVVEKTSLIESPNLKEVRHVFVKKGREYGYVVLVEMIRFSVRSSKLLKRKYKEAKNKIKKITGKHVLHKEEIKKEKEVSNFLKKISEYKHKLRKIKNKVIEEEKKK